MINLVLGKLLYIGTPVAASKQAPKQVSAVKTETKKVETKVVAAKSTAPVAVKKEVKKPTTTKLKADGTPDMRYAENKAKKAVTPGPTKKDGTPDMRFKSNKTAKKN